MNTGCSLLEAKGIKPADKAVIGISDEDVIQYCARCSRSSCRLQDEDGMDFYYNKAVFNEGHEAVYQCMQCGTIETLTFANGVMETTQKFTQVGDKVYHRTNCGECRKVG